MNKSVDEIAKIVSGTVVGDGSTRITGLNGIREAANGDLTFLGDPRYRPYLETTEAAAILVPPDLTHAPRPIIQVQNPHMAFALMLKDCEADILKHPTGIHPTAVVGDNVVLGENVALDAHVRVADECSIEDNAVLYAGTYLGRGCTVGEGTILYPNVVVREYTKIGARCIIHSNSSIGSDGFGYVARDGIQARIPQVGTVVLCDDVEIGSNSAVDRATSGQTFIGRGTKIDNLVQIGHNVRIGEHCVLAGGTVVAGSAIIGNHVTVGGVVAINGHLEIGDGVVIGGRSGITKSIEPGRTVSGYPAYDHGEAKRILMGQRRLPDALRRIKQLEARLEKLEKQRNGKTADHQ